MELSTRDLTVLKLVGTFIQLASSHLTELVFSDRSHSVPDKVLGRLAARQFLTVVGRRASGDKGGAGPFVYRLGRYGRSLLGVEGRQSTRMNDHALMIADTFTALRRAETAGHLRITEWAVERPVQTVRADLFVAVEYPAQSRRSQYYLEIDTGSEWERQITEKLNGYWRAAQADDAEYFPYVVFVVKNTARQAELLRFIRRMPEERQEMVRVFLLNELIPALAQL
ncbi:replication-relaxation family protein [Streptomyces sp. NPDC057144]|uniref:replication-relaxation family protein n=1 Tax=Streptomyces sp. NPDC057144 TaxID=3346034 RepID=UPI0036296012